MENRDLGIEFFLIENLPVSEEIEYSCVKRVKYFGVVFTIEGRNNDEVNAEINKRRDLYKSLEKYLADQSNTRE